MAGTKKKAATEKRDRITNHDLVWFFLNFNRNYFKGKLDPCIKVSFKNIRPLGRTKRVWFTRPATRKERTENKLNKTAVACYWIPRIWISDKLKFSPRLAIGTLFHEMVHAEDMKRDCQGTNWNGFHRRMLKLARDGAFKGWW